MATLRHTKDGLLIPAAWVKRWGNTVAVQRTEDLVILESPQREAARRRLRRMVRKLRRYGRADGVMTPEALTRTVRRLRRQRARRR